MRPTPANAEAALGSCAVRELIHRRLRGITPAPSGARRRPHDGQEEEGAVTNRVICRYGPVAPRAGMGYLMPGYFKAVDVIN